MEDPKQAKILMIEDDETQRLMYGLQFERSGYAHFSAVESGQAGLEAMREDGPDLLLLDIGLEDMDGLEVLRIMKEDKELSEIPVIMLSNMREKDKGSEARELGAIDYLLKVHLLPREVVAHVERFLTSQK